MTISVVKGQRAELTKQSPGLSQIVVGVGWNASAQLELDTSAFLLGSNGKVSRDEDLIFYNNPSTAFITYQDAQNGSDQKQFRVDLSKIPANVEKIAVTLTIYEGEKRGMSFRDVRNTHLSIRSEATGEELIRYDVEQFSVETAVVVGELYRHQQGWKFNAIGSGFADGLNALCKNFGVDVEEEPAAKPAPVPAPQPKAAPQAAPAPRPAPTPAPQPVAPTMAPVSLSKIELKKKGDKINLQKKSGNLGEILVNLNWNRKQSGGLFKKQNGVDLDLACLYEMKNGDKGLIQSLGKSFGCFSGYPYVFLDGDDRTGTVKTGENLRINGNQLKEFKRLLVFTFIYEGVTRWADADGVVTIKQEGGPDIIVNLDEHDNHRAMCAIAMIQNVGDETFSIERLVQYYSGHQELDQAYGWGLRWKAGKK
jgi:tellurite resistance protein TerA